MVNISRLCYLINLGESFPSTLSSLLIIYLIYDMGHWNVFANNTAPVGSVDNIWSNVFQFYGGATSAIISNELAVTVLLIVHRRKSLDPLKHWIALALISNLPSLSIILIYLTGLAFQPQVYVAEMYYYYLRLASIFLNFIVYIATTILVRNMSAGRNRITMKQSLQERAINTLVTRLKYYPMVQTISRLGKAWYEFQYGFNFTPANPSSLQQGALILVAVLTPLASVGYLVIFLMLQPQAWQFLCTRMMTCRREHTSDGRGVITAPGEDTNCTAGETHTDMHMVARDRASDFGDTNANNHNSSRGQLGEDSVHYNLGLNLQQRTTEDLCRAIDYETSGRPTGGTEPKGSMYFNSSEAAFTTSTVSFGMRFSGSNEFVNPMASKLSTLNPHANVAL